MFGNDMLIPPSSTNLLSRGLFAAERQQRLEREKYEAEIHQWKTRYEDLHKVLESWETGPEEYKGGVSEEEAQSLRQRCDAAEERADRADRRAREAEERVEDLEKQAGELRRDLDAASRREDEEAARAEEEATAHDSETVEELVRQQVARKEEEFEKRLTDMDDAWIERLRQQQEGNAAELKKLELELATEKNEAAGREIRAMEENRYFLHGRGWNPPIPLHEC